MNLKYFLLSICELFFFAHVHPNGDLPAEAQVAKVSHFWVDFLHKNGICVAGDKIAQMANDLDEDEPIIEQLSDEANYKPPPPSPAHPAFERTYSNKFASPSLLKKSESISIGKTQQKFAIQTVHSNGPLAKIYHSLTKGNFLLGKLGKMALTVQQTAKNFLSLKNLIKSNGIIGPKLLKEIDETIKKIAKENGIPYGKKAKLDRKMGWRELINEAANVWAALRQNENGEEHARTIVELWGLTKQNFHTYFEKNKSEKRTQKGGEAKKRRRRKRVGILATMAIVIGIAFVLASLYLWFVSKKLPKMLGQEDDG